MLILCAYIRTNIKHTEKVNKTLFVRIVSFYIEEHASYTTTRKMLQLYKCIYIRLLAHNGPKFNQNN